MWVDNNGATGSLLVLHEIFCGLLWGGGRTWVRWNIMTSM
jgi:hypothetical protein